MRHSLNPDTARVDATSSENIMHDFGPMDDWPNVQSRQTNYGIVFGYAMHGRCVGYLEVGVDYPGARFFRVETVYVHPSYRRQGIATALYSAAVNQLGEVRHAPQGQLTRDGINWIKALTRRARV